MSSHALVNAPALLLYFAQFPYTLTQGNGPAFLLHFAQWLQQREWALALSGSLWAFPYVQLIHYTGISIWLGTTLMVDMRFLGWVRKKENAAEFTREMMWLNWVGLAIVVTGGFLLFSGNPETYFLNVAFRLKFPLLLFGILYHGFLQAKQLKWGRSETIPGAAKFWCFTEMLIWLGVVILATRIPNN